MSAQDPHPLIVVGYDGSPSSEAALNRAVARAGGTGRVVVVHAYSAPNDYLGASYYSVALETAADYAESLMSRLDGDARLADVDWEKDVIPGAAAPAIANVAEVRDADEIMLGTRGVGRVRGLLGSVAHEVLHLATCPVTVIPERFLDRTSESRAEGAAAAG